MLSRKQREEKQVIASTEKEVISVKTRAVDWKLVRENKNLGDFIAREEEAEQKQEGDGSLFKL